MDLLGAGGVCMRGGLGFFTASCLLLLDNARNPVHEAVTRLSILVLTRKRAGSTSRLSMRNSVWIFTGSLKDLL